MGAFSFLPFLSLTLFVVLPALLSSELFHFLTILACLTLQDFDFELEKRLIMIKILILSKVTLISTDLELKSD